MYSRILSRAFSAARFPRMSSGLLLSRRTVPHTLRTFPSYYHVAARFSSEAQPAIANTQQRATLSPSPNSPTTLSPLHPPPIYRSFSAFLIQTQQRSKNNDNQDHSETNSATEVSQSSSTKARGANDKSLSRLRFHTTGGAVKLPKREEAHDDAPAEAKRVIYELVHPVAKRINRLLGEEDIQGARQVLKGARESAQYLRSADLYAGFVQYYLRHKQEQEAIRMCEEMRLEGTQISSKIYLFFMQYYETVRDYAEVLRLYDLMRSEGLHVSLRHICVVTDVLFKRGNFRQVIEAVGPLLDAGGRTTFYALYRTVLWACVKLNDFAAFRSFWARHFAHSSTKGPPSASAVLILLRSICESDEVNAEHVKWVFAELGRMKELPSPADISECIARAITMSSLDRPVTARQLYEYFTARGVVLTDDGYERICRRYGDDLTFTRSVLHHAAHSGKVATKVAVAYLENAIEARNAQETEFAYKLLESQGDGNIYEVQYYRLCQMLVQGNVVEAMEYAKTNNHRLDPDGYAMFIVGHALKGDFASAMTTWQEALHSQLPRIPRFILAALRACGLCPLQPGETLSQRLETLREVWEEGLRIVVERIEAEGLYRSQWSDAYKSADMARRVALRDKNTMSTRLGTARLESMVRLGCYKEAGAWTRLLLSGSNFVCANLPFALSLALMSSPDLTVANAGRSLWKAVLGDREIPSSTTGPWHVIRASYPRWSHQRLPIDNATLLKRISEHVPFLNVQND